MKKTLFLFAVLSVFLLTGCGNDDILDGVVSSEETAGIPFSATIDATDVIVADDGAASPGGPAKELVHPDGPEGDGKTIKFRFKVGEKVALVYTAGGSKRLVEATVSSIEGGGSKANITASLAGSPSTGTAVTAIFPYSAADPTTKDIKADLLSTATQLGTIEDISKKYDVRKGSSKFLIKDGKASFIDGCIMDLQYAICKLTFKNASSANLNVAKLYLYDNASNDLITTVKPAPATNTLYVAFKPSSSKTKFVVLTSLNASSAPTKKILNARLNAGYYYRPTITTDGTPVNIDEDDVTEEMKNLVIGHKGNLYATIKSCREDGGEKERALICYVGNDPAARCEKGLAIAFVDINRLGAPLWLFGPETVSADNNFQNIVSTWAETWDFDDRQNDGNMAGYMEGYVPATATRGWRCPSVTDWQYVIRGLDGSDREIMTKDEIMASTPQIEPYKNNGYGISFSDWETIDNEILRSVGFDYSKLEISGFGGGAWIVSHQGFTRYDLALKEPNITVIGGSGGIYVNCMFLADEYNDTYVWGYIGKHSYYGNNFSSNYLGLIRKQGVAPNYTSTSIPGFIRPVLAF
ncbi:MAG: hypothetical protein IJV23_07115 [Prevotella sp.]|nr:hypothetical protein [Prevotella sp.]